MRQQRTERGRIAAGLAIAIAVVLFAAACLPVSAALAATTSIKASPAVGPAATSITVSGTGYGAGESVRVTFDGTVAAAPTALADGHFSAVVVAPASAIPGGHNVVATGQTSGLSLATLFTVQNNWSQFLGRPGGRVNSAENGLSTAVVAAGLTRDWAAPTAGAITSSPAVVNGEVFVGSSDKTVRAVNALSGIVRWTATTGGAVSSSPAVANSLVYVGSADGKLYAFRSANGTLQWTHVAGGPITSSPAVSNGVVYVGSADGKLSALNAATGVVAWTASTGAAISSSPEKLGGSVYVGSTDGKVYAFNAVSGAGQWTATTGGAVTSSPAVAGGAVYVGSGDGKLYAFDEKTGEIEWAKATGGAVGSSPAVSDGVVYVGSNNGNLDAFATKTGAIDWSATTGGPIASSPAVADGVVYVGSNDSKLYAFSAACPSASCAPLWTGATGAAVGSSPAVANGVVYVGSSDGALYAFAPTSSATADWPAYLGGPTHASVNAAATTITPQNADAMVQSWHWTPDAAPLPSLTSGLFASPTDYNHQLFFGSDNGSFYALDDRTGALLWKRFIGYVTATTCGSRGFVATATVASDPATGHPTVYVAAPDGYLYALNAADGSLLWRSVIAIPSTTKNDYFNWSSPTVANGRIYVGLASQCDVPLIRGGLKAFDQASGSLLASYFTMAPGEVGGTIWSSAAVASDGSVFVTTGNQANGVPLSQYGDSLSIVRLDGITLAKLGIYTVPHTQQCGDCDFGGSPTLFSAKIAGTSTPMVGACNKNGTYYALRQADLSLVWSFHVGAKSSETNNAQCDAAAIFDGSHLFVAGDATHIATVNYGGSVRELDPATGRPIWEAGLPGAILGSPAMDGSGVIAAASFDYSGVPNAAYLIRASTGAILSTLSTLKSAAFPQPVFADNLLLLGTMKQGLLAYRPA